MWMFSFFAALEGLDSHLVIDQTVALHDMHGFALRRAPDINHGNRAGFDPEGIDHERIALIMANGIAQPGWDEGRRMLRIQPDMTRLRRVLIQDDDLMFLLEQCDLLRIQDVRHRLRRALV